MPKDTFYVSPMEKKGSFKIPTDLSVHELARSLGSISLHMTEPFQRFVMVTFKRPTTTADQTRIQHWQLSKEASDSEIAGAMALEYEFQESYQLLCTLGWLFEKSNSPQSRLLLRSSGDAKVLPNLFRLRVDSLEQGFVTVAVWQTFVQQKKGIVPQWHCDAFIPAAARYPAGSNLFAVVAS